MSNSHPFPAVDLSVALIESGSRMLFVWNDNWGAFTLPMTKIRSWASAAGTPDSASETAAQAAVRAAASGLGRPLFRDEIPSGPEPLDLQPYSHRSQRDGQWRRYGREVFVFSLQPDAATDRADGLWLAANELDALEPISPTAREIVRIWSARRGERSKA